MLRDMFELAKDAISKNSIISKVFLEKIFKFLLRHWILSFEATFLLVPLLDHCLAEKKNSKKDSILPISPNGFEIIFTLLAETIAI